LMLLSSGNISRVRRYWQHPPFSIPTHIALIIKSLENNENVRVGQRAAPHWTPL